MASAMNAPDHSSRHPSVIGATTVVGMLVGAAVGGLSGNFSLWVPVLAVAGVLLGLLLTRGGPR